MLDSAACAHSWGKWHFLLKSALGWLKPLTSAPGWLTIPMLGVLLLLTLPGFTRLVPPRRWRRRHRRQLNYLKVALFLIALIVFLPPVIALANQDLVGWVPPDSGARADTIVLLGRGPTLGNERVEVGAELWRLQRAPAIFASGKGDALLMIQELRAKGIPAKALDGENCSLTTEENAQYTAAVLQPQGKKRIILVTDPPHMLRSLLTFRNLGFTVIAHTSPLPSDWADFKKVLIVFREYTGLIVYCLLGRFLP